jgi:predicted Rossmann fold nucleotide-binding protein DprA/Smf involved in DNA uptake
MTFVLSDLVRLHSGIPGMTPALMRDILQSTEEQSVPLSDIFDLSVSDLTRRYLQMSEKVAARLSSSSVDSANKTLEQLQNKGFKLITFLDEQYPFKDLSFASSMPPL